MKTLFLFLVLLPFSLLAKDACTIKQINNVRTGPDAQEQLIKKLPIYTPLIILEEATEWTKVKGVDFEGWIYTSLIDKKTDCMVILDPKKPYCFKQKEKLNRPISFNEGFKIIKQDVGCNLVEGKWGKQIWLNSNNIWPKSAAKLLQI